MFNSLQFVESLKRNELTILEGARLPYESVFALCATFESLMWFVQGVNLEYFDQRNASDVIKFYFNPLLSRLRRETSLEDNVLSAVLLQQGVALGSTRRSMDYGLIQANLPAFEPALAAFVTERDPFSSIRSERGEDVSWAFESVYAPACVFNADDDLQRFIKVLSFANDTEWSELLNSMKKEDSARHIVDMLEYTMDQKRAIEDENVRTLDLDTFVRSAQGWRMSLRSRFAAERLTGLAGVLDREFDFTGRNDDFGSFTEAVITIRNFWQSYLAVGA
jgi:hypothetical protein